MKKIVYGGEARKVLKVGIDSVKNCVAPTIGPKGRNVAVDNGFGGPKISNDGVSIAREIVLEDPLENIGANIIKDVAQKTNDAAGDGTTTSVILTQAIIEEGMRKLDVGVGSISLKNGIDKASKIAIGYLNNISKQIVSDEEISQVAIISSESEDIGNMISETISELGTDAVLTVETSNTTGITSEISKGMEFENGFISPYMITNPGRMEAECKDVSILVTDYTLGTINELIPFLESVMKSGKRDLVIIAEDITGEALQNFVVNKMRGSLNVLGIKTPGFGDRKKDYLEDIAIVTGATLISNQVGLSLEKVTLDHLGHADRVVSTKDKTTIIGGKGGNKDIDNRIAYVRKELEGLDSKHDQIKVTERIAKLSGGIAIIKVGAATETETEYLKLKVEDSISAVKAAQEEGIIAGGGSSLIGAAKAVSEEKDRGEYTSDEKIGFNILAKALKYPLEQIAKNCGLGDGSLVVYEVLKMKVGGGYDALKGVYVDDMIEEGIIDPVKVTRSAIENAVSAGGTFLTTEVAMAEIPKDNPTMPGM